MMQTFSKQELAWMYDALNKQVTENLRVVHNTEEGSLAYELAHLKVENLRATMHKIHTALNQGCKRIAIK